MAEIQSLKQEVQELKQIVASLTLIPGTVQMQIGGKTISYKCETIC